MGTFEFTTFAYSYVMGDEWDTTVTMTDYYDTIVYRGFIDTLGKNRLYIKYQNKENYYDGCLEGTDTLHYGYGLITPGVDTLNPMLLSNPFSACYNPYIFEGKFETTDSLVFTIEGEGLGGGHFETVVGVRK